MPDSTIYEDVDDENFYNYASPSYLGEEGMTISCVHAMFAVLTSPFRPQKITMLSLPFRGDVGTAHDAVMFFVWDWPREWKGTVIPDGFGTHGGTGGWGLATVLGLIRFCDVPLEQVVIHDKDMFTELAREGKLTPTMFTLLKRAHPYNWSYYTVSDVRQVKKGPLMFLEVGDWKFPLLGAMKP